MPLTIFLLKYLHFYIVHKPEFLNNYSFLKDKVIFLFLLIFLFNIIIFYIFLLNCHETDLF